MNEVTVLLRKAREGDSQALGTLFSLVYPELKRIARSRLARNKGGTHLNPTALVNECYLKLAAAEQVPVGDRPHFLAYAAAAMRSIVVDAARANLTHRRGDGQRPLTLNSEIVDGTPSGEEESVFVDEVLSELASITPRLARVVEMRIFGGMSDDEIGAARDVTGRTVHRDWTKARLVRAASLRR